MPEKVADEVSAILTQGLALTPAVNELLSLCAAAAANPTAKVFASSSVLRAKAPAWCLATTGVATTGARRTWARAERRVVVGTFVETARTAEADMEAWSFVCAVGNGNNASLLA